MPPEVWMNDQIRAAAREALENCREGWSESVKANEVLRAVGPLIAAALEGENK